MSHWSPTFSQVFVLHLPRPGAARTAGRPPRAGAQPVGLEPRHLGAELLRGVPLVDDVLRN